MHYLISILVLIASFMSASLTWATTYPLPPETQTLIGEVKTITTSGQDTTASIAKQYGIGFNALSAANPWIQGDYRFQAGTPLKITTQHVLPNQARTGIVINLPEMRLYFYPENSSVVKTFPIGIGKIGKTIPIQTTSIVRKKKDPIWTPTESIHQFNREQGIILPKVIGPGPDNPLGQYAIYLGIPTYLIHSSPFTESIGKRASFGCIRMFESDIEEELFPTVKAGVTVAIINQPLKFGWENQSLFMEAHPALDEHTQDSANTLISATQHILQISKSNPTLIDWQLVAYLAKERDGTPHEIGVEIQQ